MKKKALLVIAALVCALSVFALSACTFGDDGTVKVKAKGKADSLDLLYDFVDVIGEDADMVVTYKSGDEVQYVESVKGTTANVVGKDGSVLYAFIKDGEYYYAFDDGEYRYFEANKEMYDAYYYYFLVDIDLFDMLPEDSGTFTCSTATKEKETDGVIESTATLKFKFDSEYGSFTVNASATNGKVEEIVIDRVETAEPENDRTFTITFEYGNAEVTVPDVAAWELYERNDSAIYTRDEFFFSTLYSDNVIITMGNGESVFVETIANGVDVFDIEGFKTYSFMTEEGEFIFALEDGDSKYYYVGEDWYEIGCDVYYNTYISIFDVLAHSRLEFYCEVEEDEESGDGSLIFTIGNDDGAIYTLIATRTAYLVTEATVTAGEGTLTISFVYDEAEVSAPDISDWTREETEEPVDPEE